MSFIFDTSVIIDVVNRQQSTIAQLKEIARLYPGPGQITFITCFEFLLGLKEKSPKNKERAESFIHQFECLQATKTTAQILADLKWSYSKKGETISLADLIIAAQAIENNGTLITRDKAFEKISELKKIILK